MKLEVLKDNLMALDPNGNSNKVTLPGGCYFHIPNTSNTETERILSELTGREIELDYNGIDITNYAR